MLSNYYNIKPFFSITLTLSFLVIFFSCKEEVTNKSNNSAFVNFKPSVKIKVDSFLNNSEFKIFQCYITRLESNTIFQIIPIDGKNYFKYNNYPEDYLFYNGRLLLFYNGIEMISSNERYSKRWLEKRYDSVCSKNYN